MVCDEFLTYSYLSNKNMLDYICQLEQYQHNIKYSEYELKRNEELEQILHSTEDKLRLLQQQIKGLYLLYDLKTHATIKEI